MIERMRTIENDGIQDLLLSLDAHDWRDVQAAMQLRESYYVPDASHDDSNREGILIGEICRSWLEFMEISEQKRGDQ